MWLLTGTGDPGLEVVLWLTPSTRRMGLPTFRTWWTTPSSDCMPTSHRKWGWLCSSSPTLAGFMTGPLAKLTARLPSSLLFFCAFFLNVLWGTGEAEMTVLTSENPRLWEVLSINAMIGWKIALLVLPAAGNSAFLICACSVHSTSFSSKHL